MFIWDPCPELFKIVWISKLIKEFLHLFKTSDAFQVTSKLLSAQDSFQILLWLIQTWSRLFGTQSRLSELPLDSLKLLKTRLKSSERKLFLQTLLRLFRIYLKLVMTFEDLSDFCLGIFQKTWRLVLRIWNTSSLAICGTFLISVFFLVVVIVSTVSRVRTW